MDAARAKAALESKPVARYTRTTLFCVATSDIRDMRGRFDAIDLKILAELQADGRMTNVELARRVGISAPPCLRRVRALEEADVIRGYRALLDERRLGFEVTAFAMVQLAGNSEADLAAFEARVRDWPQVRECHMLSGEVDFMLKCVAKDLTSFQSFVIELTSARNVKTVKTALALGQTKNEASAPFDITES
ncbi:AsnC family transcriptional regulator [Methylopila jiangsuensis]|uniref:AsnC family transcriptional regulator n=2 Tax=Methylopila jiangsuensis TaxID=586230 RepID=A0A9W6JG44_9HYPH|nr:AsnC family transcriptional regulator [Methylopila jiangsuensis]